MADYEDRIISDEVRRKMNEAVAKAAAEGIEVESKYYTGSDLDYMKEFARLNDAGVITGPFEDFGRGVNVPRTPTLFNLFAMQEELAHNREPESPDIREPKRMMKDGTRLESLRLRMKQDEYDEEQRAKDEALKKTGGLLPESKRTEELTRRSYAIRFMNAIDEYVKKTGDLETKKALLEQYPELKNIEPIQYPEGEEPFETGGVVSLLDRAQNMNRDPKGVASLSSVARNMNRPMVSMSEGGTVSSVGPSAEARDQAARMTLIEMQMEPGAREIFDNNPYARIGLDILERGEYPDQSTADMGARLTALIVGEGDVIPSGLRGLTVPSYALSTDALGADEIPSGLDSRGSSKQTSPAEALAEQGVTDGEMPRSEGSTAYFLASGEPDEKMAYTGRRRTLQIIAHELGHLGYMALQRSNRQKTGNPLYDADEFTLDVKDYESSRRMGIKPMADDIRAYENLTSDKELIPGITRGEYNRAILRQQERDAINLMQERGMPLIEQGPPEPPPEPEKGIGVKFLELLGLQ